MNFSARRAPRKWAFDPTGCDQRPILFSALLALIVTGIGPGQAASIATAVPLPRPRPVAASSVPQKPVEAESSGEADKSGPDMPATEARQAEAQPPSACRLALDDNVAIAPSIPAIHGPGACGGDDLVRLQAIVLPDKERIPLQPPATMRCGMASAVADWLRTDLVPMAFGLGTKISELDNFDSFDCRGRNRVAGAKLSEHGRANALDVRAIKLANGQSIALTDRDTPRDLREKVLSSVCARFSTVLGPGSDGYHEDHVHLDLAERRGDYKICQWIVWDALPKIAPLMPVERPLDAPRREVADGKDDEKSAGAGPSDAKPAQPTAAAPAAKLSAATEPEVAKPEYIPVVRPVPKPRPRERRAPPSPFSFLR